MREILKNKIKRVIQDLSQTEESWQVLTSEEVNFEVSLARDEKFGDLASNAAMALAGKLGQNPLTVAKIIVEKLEKEPDSRIAKIDTVLPGYINFYFSKKYLSEEIRKIIKAEKDWGKSDILAGKKYIFEHSSPNLFKPFHIGHLVNNSIGESLARIIKKCGADLKTLSFPSDISPGIAKTVWAIKEKSWQEEMTIKKIGQAYVLGVAAYKEDEAIKNEIDKINEILYRGENSPEREIYEKGKKMSLDYFEEITQRLGSLFEDLIFESEAESRGKELVKKNIPEIFTESAGAIIFPGSKYGLFDNVFVNSQGFGTYLAKDLGLLEIKFERFEFDKSITITDVEQREHFKLVQKAGGLVNEDWAEKSEFIQHGRLSFSGEKISSRLGNVPLAEDLINKVKEKIFAKMEKQAFSPAEKELIAEKVAIGALKYSILKSGAGKNIVFDFEKATSFEGDTGPYLQYALVRLNSVLKNAQGAQMEIEPDLKERAGEIPLVEKMVLQFPWVVEKSFLDKSPHHLANYLFKLSSEFSSFYAQTKIVDAANPDLKNNLMLTKALQITLANGLELLGLEKLEKM
ncbi:MAG: arginine--tRNA ligase [Candidatus Moraniibacteriota bacterium]